MQVVSQSATNEVKTVYTVRIEERNVAFKFTVNDIPVLTEQDDASATISNFLINPWLINGRNTFRMEIMRKKSSPTDPEDPKGCKVMISGARNREQADTIVEKELSIFGSDTVSFTEGSFAIALGYAQPPWAQSEKIGKDAATQKKILDKYREFYRLLDKKELVGIMKFSSAKFREYAKSMYDPDFISDKENSFKEEFATPPGYLISIDEQEKFGLHYEYYCNDHLVSINNDEERSIIQYYNDDDGVTTQYRLYFYFDGQDFILIL